MAKIRKDSGKNMDVINILEKLVSFNTIQDKENKKIINYIEEIMKSI